MEWMVHVCNAWMSLDCGISILSARLIYLYRYANAATNAMARIEERYVDSQYMRGGNSPNGMGQKERKN